MGFSVIVMLLVDGRIGPAGPGASRRLKGSAAGQGQRDGHRAKHRQPECQGRTCAKILTASSHPAPHLRVPCPKLGKMPRRDHHPDPPASTLVSNWNLQRHVLLGGRIQRHLAAHAGRPPPERQRYTAGDAIHSARSHVCSPSPTSSASVPFYNGRAPSRGERNRYPDAMVPGGMGLFLRLNTTTTWDGVALVGASKSERTSLTTSAFDWLARRAFRPARGCSTKRAHPLESVAARLSGRDRVQDPGRNNLEIYWNIRLRSARGIVAPASTGALRRRWRNR